VQSPTRGPPGNSPGRCRIRSATPDAELLVNGYDSVPIRLPFSMATRSRSPTRNPAVDPRRAGNTQLFDSGAFTDLAGAAVPRRRHGDGNRPGDASSCLTDGREYTVGPNPLVFGETGDPTSWSRGTMNAPLSRAACCRRRGSTARISCRPIWILSPWRTESDWNRVVHHSPATRRREWRAIAAAPWAVPGGPRVGDARPRPREYGTAWADPMMDSPAATGPERRRFRGASSVDSRGETESPTNVSRGCNRASTVFYAIFRSSCPRS